MEKIINNKKIFTALIVFVIVLIALVLLQLTMEMRIVGTWQRETLYLEKYGCDSVMVNEFYKNHTYSEVMYEEGTGRVLRTEEGNWEVSGIFEIAAKTPGDDGTTHYAFNPITGTLKNNVHYRKVG